MRKLKKTSAQCGGMLPPEVPFTCTECLQGAAAECADNHSVEAEMEQSSVFSIKSLHTSLIRSFFHLTSSCFFFFSFCHSDSVPGSFWAPQDRWRTEDLQPRQEIQTGQVIIFKCLCFWWLRPLCPTAILEIGTYVVLVPGDPLGLVFMASSVMIDNDSC